MAYNFLKNARTIKNSELCIHDNLDGYSSDFHENGNVDGWDVYDNIYLYGCWNGILFGTAYDRDCYVSRSNNFSIVEAEDYYYVKIMMKITNNSPNTTATTLTTGRIQWTVLGDSTWTSDKQIDFDIIDDNKWRLYTVNMGPAQNWQGNINNLRIYPFVDGKNKDQFAIKFIKISSLSTYACDNTQCSYYLQYSHPCPGIGGRGTCEAGVSKALYTTVSGISDSLVVNINGYGYEYFTLGDNSNLTGVEMAKIIANKISALNVGGYTYSFCEYSELDKLKITSGSVGVDSSVSISGTAAEALGFYENNVNVSDISNGTEPATGFDYASSRILTALDINRLIDGNSDDFAYIHNPSQYSVEGGRRDFNEIGVSQLLSTITTQTYLGEYYDSLNNEGRTLIDFSHPFNNNGRITSIYMYGVVDTLSKIKILRPYRDGSFKVIHSLNLPLENDSYIYTSNPVVYRVDCNILVEKGDLLGIYNANLYVGVSPSGLPEATFVQVDGNVSGVFTTEDPLSLGVGGFAIYARGDRWQTNTILDIDLGDRVNIEEINIYGSEDSAYFEFNVACCEDVSWQVDLFSGTHQHAGINWLNGIRFVHTHQNIAYGLNCLDDCIKTADNGQVGTTYGKDSDGLWTSGDDHSYFYVNGDAEWLYTWDCSIGGKYEYCGNSVPYGTRSFVYDPIALTLTFPYEFEIDVHKSIIYFKERNNFRSLSLSYYLGQYSNIGNSDDRGYNYIPEYTSVRLDGILYEDDDDAISNAYIFSNPMSSKPIYSGADVNPINWEIVEAAHGTDWSVIEHNFDPVTCKGFRIYTDHHRSTKITEIEVYSKMTTSASLVDNITLSFSDYGDIWTSVGFEEIDTEHVNAFIGSAPRYFRLGLDSATEFSLNEIEMLVGDQVDVAQCDDVILLDNAKSNAVNTSTPVVIENVYDKPFDLYVDLPKETSGTDDLIFWSKLGSYDQISQPEFGPSCKLHKQDDYLIRNDNRQCAINVPAYGLKNLVHGKRAYYSHNDVDYIYWGTITSGTAMDFCNTYYTDRYYSEIFFGAVASARYWKIATETVDKQAVIHDIIAYFEGTRVPIYYLYSSSDPGISAQLYGFTSDGTEIDELVGITDNFDDATYSGTWTKGGTADSSVAEDNGRIYAAAFGTGVTWVGPTITASFDNDLPDYYLIYDWRINYEQMYRFTVSLLDNSDVIITRVLIADGWSGSLPKYFNLNIYNKAGSEITPNLFITADDAGVDRTIHCEMLRNGSSLVFKTNGTEYFSGTIDTDLISKVRVEFEGNNSYPPTPSEFALEYISVTSPPMLADDRAFGLSIGGSDPIDSIKLIHSDCSIGGMSVYTSFNNTNNYVLVASGVTADPSNYSTYTRLAVDLEERHDIDIIRNYGDSDSLEWFSVSEATDFSNSDVLDVDDVDWANSNKDDVRWVRFNLENDAAISCIRKLGIYPDISSAFCRDGGYNCEWESIGNVLSDYTMPVNVAYGATTTGTNYYYSNYYPDNAVDGITTDYRASSCWGFQIVDGVDPYLELDFGQLYLINKVVLYHGYDPTDSSFLNTDYIFSMSTTTTGSFTTVFSTSGNTQYERTHQFTPVYARRIRLTITGYDSEEQRFGFDEATGQYIVFDGCYLREIEVYTYVDVGYVDSETWPVVCMDMQDQFNITGHELVNKDVTDTSTDWNNNESFFMYSDNIFDDPQKVSFNSQGEYRIDYQKTETFTVDVGATEYLFNTVSGTYFYEGMYFVEWEARSDSDLYNADYPPEEKISLRLDGPDIVDHFADITAADTWLTQSGSINVPRAGFYSVKGIQHIDATYGWGVKDPVIYRSVGLRKWIAVKRDTAENYSYGNNTSRYGPDYLSLVKVYGDEKYTPTEYSWWWDSTLSTLSNDYMNVKVGSRSLKISYPTSSGTDIVSFVEGDDFGSDAFFEAKDTLHFWWRISNVDILDEDYGDITFGVLNDSDPVYYTWNISSLNLVTGWNNIKLKFEDADYVYPVLESYYVLSDYFDEKLDFRTNEKDFSSLRFRYRGKGTSFTMNIDDLKIERNIFEDDVKFGKGLCLTGYDYLEIPLSNITLEKGTIEFWTKLYTDTYGRNIYGDFNSRVFFTLVNNNNDIISLGIKSGVWFEPLSGHIRKALNVFDIDSENLPLAAFYDIGEILHLAVVWSNDGSFMDNNDTLRFYINNELICKSATGWTVEDTKSAILKLGGATTQMALNKDPYGAAIFDNVRIYNYCKTDFNIEREDIDKEITYTPNDFLEISSDNVTFSGVGSASLPIVFQGVPAGETRTVYVRANKNDNFLQSKKTATLIIDWLTTV